MMVLSLSFLAFFYDGNRKTTRVASGVSLIFGGSFNDDVVDELSREGVCD